MNNLLIIGAGSFSIEIEELACLLNYTDISFIDDNPDKARAHPVIGTMKDIGKFRARYDNAIVALGNNVNRKKHTEILNSYCFNIPVLVHPTAYISPDAKLSPGCIIRTHAVVSRYVELGTGVIVNVGGMIDHHCVIGEFSHILMGAVVRNSVKVKPLTWIDSNQVVHENLLFGHHCFLRLC